MNIAIIIVCVAWIGLLVGFLIGSWWGTSRVIRKWMQSTERR